MRYETTTCNACRAEVVLGPDGGYCCGHCPKVVLPNNYAQTSAATLKRLEAEKRARGIKRTAGST